MTSMTPHAPHEFPGSKADALAWLRPRLERSQVLELLWFRAADWRADADAVVRRVMERFPSQPIIVRSSALDESNAQSSNSGVNDSITNVDSGNPEAVGSAIRQVLASYGSEAPGHQVLVQPMLAGVRWVAVVSTMDRDSAAPYDTFVYSETPEDTEVITSGHGRSLRQYVRHRDCRLPCPSPELEMALAAVREVESFFAVPLELELAVGRDGRMTLFQARPVIDCSRGEAAPREALAEALSALARQLPPASTPEADIFGVMPDWNPAELIGTRPAALAFSTYRRLFSDLSWAEARRDLGYTDLTGTPLVRSFVGCPFVDVRASFRSLVPAGLEPALRERLVGFQLAVLRQHPHLHDKVEFEVVASCFSPAWGRKARKLRANGFSEDEVSRVADSLRGLTRRLLEPDWVGRDLAQLARLPSVPRDGPPAGLLRSALAALEACRRDGAVPFARLARLAFVSVQCLREAASEALLEPREFDAFFRSLRTVVAELNASLARVQSGEAPPDEFLRRFGHLRPGTYDLTSPRYDEAYATYFSPVLVPRPGAGGGAERAQVPEAGGAAPFELSAHSRRGVLAFLREVGSGLSPEALFAFFRAAIEAREDAKLQFTRVLSDSLRAIQRAGEQLGAGPAELQHLGLGDLEAVAEAADPAAELRRRHLANRPRHRLTQAVKLPDLILQAADVQHHDTYLHSPNYVTRSSVTGPVVLEPDLTRRDLAGAILCLRAADPGFDWVFAHRIGGLVTRFGGANSHMAVRCAELGLPAVIGCGEADFRRWSAARILRVDCASQTVGVVV